MTLPDYFASIAKRRWRYGDLDCSTFISDWAMMCGFADPMKDLRGRYSDQKSYLRLVRAEGGFLKACGERLEAIGLRPATSPKSGDLLVVQAPYAVRRGQTQRRPTGALAADASRVAIVTPDKGLVIADQTALPIINVWTF